jgi:hypothetical protein
MDPYVVLITVCYNNLKKYNVLLSLLFNHLYMHRLCFILPVFDRRIKVIYGTNTQQDAFLKD